jgi:uncharacterized protein DUF397
MNNAVEENGSAPSLVWIKSSLSFANCVEAARLSGEQIGVRHSKDPHGGILQFTPAEWSAFPCSVRNGEFDV